MSRFPEQARLIETYLAQAELSPEAMAAAVMITPETMRKLRKGYQKASPRLMDLMARTAMTSTLDPLVERERESRRFPPLRRLPVIEWSQVMQAADPRTLNPGEERVAVEITSSEAIALRIGGDSMTPTFEPGDIVILDCSVPPSNGDAVFARLRDEGMACGKLQIINPATRLYRLIPMNGLFAPIERRHDEIEWIYPIDQLIRKWRQ